MFKIPMQYRFCSETFDRHLKQNDMCFGDVPFTLGGDFVQISPFVKFVGKTDVVSAILLGSYIWTVLRNGERRRR